MGREGGNVERDKRQSETKVRVIFARPLIPRSTVPMDFECGISIVLHCSISPDMHFLRNGSDATPPLLFQSDQPGKFFSPFILHYSASRPIPPPRRLLSREIRIYASNAKTPPSGRLSPTYSINSHDRQVFFIAILELSIYFQRWKSNFIYFSFFSFFFFFFFFLLRFVTSR